MEEHLFSRILCVFALVAALAIGVPAASAAVVWTDGAAGNSNWSDPANWGGAVPGAGDTAEFASSGNQANLDASQSVNAVSFTGSTGDFTIGGGANKLSLNGGDITTPGDGGTYVIDVAGLEVNASSHDFTAGSGDTLRILAQLQNDGGLDRVDFFGPGTITIEGGTNARGYYHIYGRVDLSSDIDIDHTYIESGGELRILSGGLPGGYTVKAGGLVTYKASPGRDGSPTMEGGEIVLDGANMGDWGGTTATILRYTSGSGEQGRITGTGNIDLKSQGPWTRRIDVADDAALDVELRIDVPIIGAKLHVVKRQAGTLALNGDNTHAGPFTVEGGTLLINGDTSNGHDYTVDAGATLGGTGTIGLADGYSVTVNGTLAPGASVGTLTIDGDVAMSNASELLIELDGSTADLLDVIGELDLTDATVQVAELTTPTATEYLIATATDGVTLSGTTVSGDGAWALDLRNSDTELYLVPEPGTMALLGLGGLGILLRRRRV